MTTADASSMQVPIRTCEEVVAALQDYLAGTLPLSELVAIASHLEGCLRCMHTLELRRATLAVIIAAGDNGDGDPTPRREMRS